MFSFKWETQSSVKSKKEKVLRSDEREESVKWSFKKRGPRLLGGQWLRILLLMQATQVRSLVQEDSSCHGTPKPLHHKYWACTLEPMLCNKRSHHNEKPAQVNEEYPLITATRESPCTATKTHPSQKKKEEKIVPAALEKSVSVGKHTLITRLSHLTPGTLLKKKKKERNYLSTQVLVSEYFIAALFITTSILETSGKLINR